MADPEISQPTTPTELYQPTTPSVISTSSHDPDDSTDNSSGPDRLLDDDSSPSGLESAFAALHVNNINDPDGHLDEPDDLHRKAKVPFKVPSQVIRTWTFWGTWVRLAGTWVHLASTWLAPGCT